MRFVYRTTSFFRQSVATGPKVRVLLSQLCIRSSNKPHDKTKHALIIVLAISCQEFVGSCGCSPLISVREFSPDDQFTLAIPVLN